MHCQGLSTLQRRLALLSPRMVCTVPHAVRSHVYEDQLPTETGRSEATRLEALVSSTVIAEVTCSNQRDVLTSPRHHPECALPVHVGPQDPDGKPNRPPVPQRSAPDFEHVRSMGRVARTGADQRSLGIE